MYYKNYAKLQGYCFSAPPTIVWQLQKYDNWTQMQKYESFQCTIQDQRTYRNYLNNYTVSQKWNHIFPLPCQWESSHTASDYDWLFQYIIVPTADENCQVWNCTKVQFHTLHINCSYFAYHYWINNNYGDAHVIGDFHNEECGVVWMMMHLLNITLLVVLWENFWDAILAQLPVTPMKVHECIPFKLNWNIMQFIKENYEESQISEIS